MMRRLLWVIPIVALAALVLTAAVLLLPVAGAVLAFALSMALAIRGAARGNHQAAWIAVLLLLLVGSIVWFFVETGVQSSTLHANPGSELRASFWLSLVVVAIIVVALAVMFSRLLLRWTDERLLSRAVPAMIGGAVFLFVTLPPIAGLQIAMADAGGNAGPTIDTLWLVTLAGIPVAIIMAIGAIVAGAILLGRWGRKTASRALR
jgi:hypothetical protein